MRALYLQKERAIEEKVSFSLTDQREKQVQQFNPKALDILMEKFAIKRHPLVYTAWHQFTSTLLMEIGSISDLKTPHFRKGKCFCAPNCTVQADLLWVRRESWSCIHNLMLWKLKKPLIFIKSSSKLCVTPQTKEKSKKSFHSHLIKRRYSDPLETPCPFQTIYLC